MMRYRGQGEETHSLRAEPEVNFTEARGARTGEALPDGGMAGSCRPDSCLARHREGRRHVDGQQHMCELMLVASESRHPRPKDGHSFPGDSIGSF